MPPPPARAGHPVVSLAFLAGVATAGAAGVAFTHLLLSGPAFRPYRTAVEVAEISLVTILAVELLMRAVGQTFRRRGEEPVAQWARMVVRSTAYLILLLAMFSMLSASSILAVSVGSVTGIVVGFATQNIFSNAVGGVLLAIARRFRPGDEITVAGNSGRISRVTLMTTELAEGEDTIYVPNAVLISSIVRRKPRVFSENPPPGA